MGNEQQQREFLEKFEREAKADLAAGRVRVVQCCYECPFCHPHEDGDKQPSGNPHMRCKHPATIWSDPPVEVEIGQYGFIPMSCPLRKAPISVELEDPELVERSEYEKVRNDSE